LVGLALGCSVQPDGGMNFNTGDSSPPAANDESGQSEDDSDDDEDQDAGSSTGDDAVGTTGGETADGGETFGPLSESDSDTSPTTGSGTSGGESTGGSALSPAYGPCADHDDCEGTMACLTSDPDGEQGFCSPGCGSGDPPNHALCPNPDMGVTATKECVHSGFLNTCVLDCNGGLSCPDGTTCAMTSNGYGPYCFAE
jgi:hypothetical protein